MEQEEKKSFQIEDSPYRPPLADTCNVQPRLVRLSTLLEEICENLVESTAAARARGIVETAILLQLINFDVMELALSQIEETMLCNTYPTKPEKPCHEQVKEAFELANDILLDMPLGLGIGPSAPSEEELEARMAELSSVAPSKHAQPETVTITGKMSKFSRIITKNHEVMATFDIGGKHVAALPRTFQTYRNALESANDREAEITIKLKLDSTINGYPTDTMMELIAPVPAKPFSEGQRVRLTRDLPDTFTDVHPINHFKGDEGTIYRPYEGCELGFRSDRYHGDITTFRVTVDDERQSILLFCEAIGAEGKSE